jgi:tetratricopeptide (TPR) repeat protein
MTSTERRVLALVREIQRVEAMARHGRVDGGPPRYGLNRLVQEDVDLLLTSVSSAVVKDDFDSLCEATPPFNGTTRLAIRVTVPFAVERYLVLRHVATMVGRHDYTRESIIVKAAALCGIFDAQDVRERGGAFIDRKRIALKRVPELWTTHSLSYLLSISIHVVAELAKAGGQPLPARACSAQYHVELGQVARKHARYDDATSHLRRALRLARETKDVDAAARAILEMGRVAKEKGNFPLARKRFLRSAALARRCGLREPYAYAWHAIASVEIESVDEVAATRAAARAFSAYGPDHEYSAYLVHDLAYLWLEQGYFQRALTALGAVLPRIADETVRMVILSNVARAAAGMGAAPVYERQWESAWGLTRKHVGSSHVARTLLHLAMAAHTFGDWARAELAASEALARATATGQHRVEFCARAVLEATARHAGPEQAPSPPPVAAEADRLASRIVRRMNGLT